MNDTFISYTPPVYSDRGLMIYLRRDGTASITMDFHYYVDLRKAAYLINQLKADLSHFITDIQVQHWNKWENESTTINLNGYFKSTELPLDIINTFRSAISDDRAAYEGSTNQPNQNQPRSPLMKPFDFIAGLLDKIL